MIPTREQCYQLWDKYSLPEKKRIHVRCVAQTAIFFAEELEKKQTGIGIDKAKLEAACLLHDIDKTVPRLAGEQHPQTGVRVLRSEGMEEIAELIKNHSVQCIADEKTAPKTWEEKLLFLADKMVKYEILSVDERFDLWFQESDLPQEQKEMLKKVYPFVKTLEKEVLSLIELQVADISDRVYLTFRRTL